MQWIPRFLPIALALVAGAVCAQMDERVRALSDARKTVNSTSNELELRLLTINQAINENPGNPELQLKKGVYLLELGRTQQAVDVFEALRQAYPNHPAPYINLASAYAQQGRLEEARQMLIKSDGLQSGRYQTHLSLASVNIGLALSSIRKAAELRPGDPVTERKVREIEQLLVKVNSTAYSGSGPAVQSGDAPVVGPAARNATSGEREQPSARLQTVKPAPARREARLTLAPVELPASGAGPEAVRPSEPAQGVAEADDGGRAAVIRTIESWSQAWSLRNPEGYLQHYSAAFRPKGGGSRETWEQRRQLVIGKASFIQVEVRISRIRIQGNRAHVLLTQRYKSDQHSDTTRKELVLALENGQWRIVAENPI